MARLGADPSEPRPAGDEQDQRREDDDDEQARLAGRRTVIGHRVRVAAIAG